MRAELNFSASSDAKMSVTLNELTQNVPHSNLHRTSKHAPKTY